MNVNELSVELIGETSEKSDNKAFKGAHSSEDRGKCGKNGEGAFKGSGDSVAVLLSLGCFVVGAEDEDVLVAKIVDDRVLLDTNFGPEGIGQRMKLDANCRYQQSEAYP